MDEATRLQICHAIAVTMSMQTPGVGWGFHEIERSTRTPLPARTMHRSLRMPEPTPFARGVLDRYQDGKRVRR